MATIPASQARALFTSMLVDVYKERISPLGFLRSFFVDKISATKQISIEVQRGTEKIAVDVERGTEGNRNQFSLSTEKIFEPPLYSEYFDATSLDLYDRMFGSTAIDASAVANFIEGVAEHLGMLQDKIDRSIERQCAQVLETGIVTLTKGINIDFKRKADSLVDKGAGNYWATVGVNVFNDLEDGATFLRQKGKIRGRTINLIFGETALRDFWANDVFLAENNARRLDRMVIREPQENSVGAALHGSVSAGSYIFNIFSYPEFFDLSGVSTPYMNDKNVVFLPQQPRFSLAYAAVPQLIDTDNPVINTGRYFFDDKRDSWNKTHDYRISSAPVAIPVGVDMIYTLQVVA